MIHRGELVVKGSRSTDGGATDSPVEVSVAHGGDPGVGQMPIYVHLLRIV